MIRAGLFYLVAMVGGDLCAEEKVDFVREVRPILNKHCTGCHGGVKRKGGFSLNFRSEVIAKAKSGHFPVVPGDPLKSEVMVRILTDDLDDRMPPERDPLSKKESDILKRWIEQGAHYEQHWAYKKIEAPKSPSVSQKNWEKDKLDSYILAKLEEQGFAPEQEADRNTLIRRVYLDIVGLPPSIKDRQAFIQDSSPQAYENMVDQALAHEGYGEKWATMWLDMARFSDSDGYEKDRSRLMYPFRDYVIRALNRDIGYDQLGIEFLAGDLLPNPSQAQKVATAFHRNTMINTEGGTDNEEFRVAAVIDRVNTTWEVWMGTSMSCVQCHSHPYDPIMHDEFYKAYDYFNQTKDANKHRSPMLSVYSEEVQAKLKKSVELRDKLFEAKKTFFDIVDIQEQVNGLSADSDVWYTGTGRRIPLSKKLRETLIGYEGRPFTELNPKEKKSVKDQLYSMLFPKRAKFIFQQLQYISKHPHNVMVMEELPQAEKRKTQLFERGNWLALGKEVQAGTPAFLPPMQKGFLKNRLGFAKWMFQKDHPLTARVAVNRYWTQIFGVGLVKTSEDLGTQSEYPSHKNLLDHLSYRFMHEMNWSIKKLLKAMVMSATYRQKSVFQEEKLRWDSENRYLSRGARFRLSAEQIRDQALFVSGLLSEKMYGPSVMPPQPEGIWNSIYNGTRWQTSTGDDAYRRALYTHWKRTSPYPSMDSFDAPSKEICSSRRIRTNTPLQALVLLNDPVYVEAALHLAEEVLGKSDELEGRVGYLVRKTLLRDIGENEMKSLTALFHEEVAYFKEHPEQLRLTIDGRRADRPEELAAMATLANVVMNLDEFINKN